MSMKKMKHLCTIVTLFLLISCQDETANLNIQNSKIKEALDKRKEEYKQQILSRCTAEAILKAEEYVDSLISEEISFRLSDSIIFPDKPLKPFSPGKISISDTIRARPIIK